MRIAVIHTAGAPCGCARAASTGLHALGHEAVSVDSAEVVLRAADIARDCDLVIDHTDTFSGSGLLRSFVRSLLETHGARIVGSDAGACLRADDKATAKALLGGAGIPVPPGIRVTSKQQPLPPWLIPPVVVKPAFEHMSRGLHIAATEHEIRAGVAALLDRYGQPAVVEAFIPGREVAVSLLETERGLVVLPPLEWRTGAGETGVLTEAFKRSDVAQGRPDAAEARLTPEQMADLETLAVLAFRTLGLRDYARFDVRLSPGGTFYFLEANATPSLEPYEALALAASWAGMDYPALIGEMLSAAVRRCGRPPYRRVQRTRIPLGTGPVDLSIPEGISHPPPSTIALANLLDVRPGERVLDLGCGAGLLSIAAAKRGAVQVVATDIDPRALDATDENARANGVGGKITVCGGSWYEALGCDPQKDRPKFDVIIATPPQTPASHAFGARYGGPEGLKHWVPILQGAPACLRPDGGRLWLLAISLANTQALLGQLRACFEEVRIVGRTERPFTAREYGSMDQGLMDHFQALRLAGRSAFRDGADGGYVFENLFIRAGRMRMP